MKGDQKHLLPSTMKSLIFEYCSEKPWRPLGWAMIHNHWLMARFLPYRVFKRRWKKRCFRSNIGTYYIVEVCVCGIAVTFSVQDIVNIDCLLLATAELLSLWLNFQKAVGPWVETPDKEQGFGLIINPPNKICTFMWCLFDLQNTKPCMWNQQCGKKENARQVRGKGIFSVKYSVGKLILWGCLSHEQELVWKIFVSPKYSEWPSGHL